ncbi:hypothetical protein AWW66_25275 [Micromonospora rosaria]|uniref:Uncharacterized protein n=1 Tax=Micromonospora rosaria TaxID=47874 RepID=A0A136PLJ5_9ACTN|nr:hypothetical protein AWW66_25275 [Micromonospora rosaria]
MELPRFLAWLVDQTSQPDEVVDVSAYQGTDLGYELVEACADRGWVKGLSTFGGPAAVITLAGRHVAEQYRRDLTDPVKRAATARTGLLRWLYAQQAAGAHYPVTTHVLQSEESMYLGERLTEDDIDRAAAYLYEQGFIKGVRTAQTRGPVRVALTSKGEDCVEQYGGNVTAYQQGGQGRGNTNTFNFGPIINNGTMAVASEGFTQNTTVGVDQAGVAKLVQTLLDGLDKLQLTDEARTSARAELEAVQQEVQQPQPNTGRVTAGIGRAVNYFMEAGKPVVTAAFMLIASGYGLPPAA